jgi:hypothetical protein
MPTERAPKRVTGTKRKSCLAAKPKAAKKPRECISPAVA